MTHEHDNKPRGWIGVDFDGTLAQYSTWVSPTHCGQPVPVMVARVKRWIAEGREVRIFTARVWPIIEVIKPETELHIALAPTDRTRQALAAALAIRDWCAMNVGLVLPITCIKDYAMSELYDDRAVQVEKNTGRLVGYSTREYEYDPIRYRRHAEWKAEVLGLMSEWCELPQGSEHLTATWGAIKTLLNAPVLPSADDPPAPAICSNCDSAMPEGCGGLFRDDGPACLLNHTNPIAEGNTA